MCKVSNNDEGQSLGLSAIFTRHFYSPFHQLHVPVVWKLAQCPFEFMVQARIEKWLLSLLSEGRSYLMDSLLSPGMVPYDWMLHSYTAIPCIALIEIDCFAQLFRVPSVLGFSLHSV